MTITLETQPKVLFLDEIDLAHSAFEALAGSAEIVRMTSRSRAEFLDDLETKYEGVTAIYRHFKASKSLKITGPFDEEVIQKLPSTVRCIAHNGAGYDQINVASCSARGIQVANVPFVADTPTADTAMFLILSCLRQFPKALAHAHTGTFNSRIPLSNDPQGKVLGILGLGGIGSALAKRAVAFRMKIQYYSRNRAAEDVERATGAVYVTFNELLQTSDVISVHTPLNQHTKGLVSSEQFGLMKSSAILINTARGPIVDEAALIKAVSTGQIAGAGFDVYDNEPHIPLELLALENVVCLPHVGTVTVETQTEMEAVCMRNLKHAVETGRLPYVVAEQKSVF